ncbi:MAG: hypothetical protein IPM30_06855 [Burkholderiales bacterium]|jgi:hypothetical protein|nr:hypothetical protein [Burkholderiales bacterium]
MKRKDTGKPARAGAPRGSAPRTRGDYADPYKKARRPRPVAGDAPPFARRPRPAGDDAPPFARRPRPPAAEAPPYARERRPPRREPAEGDAGGRERGGREGGFTVSLDPDVARVFRGDASVNKALRLVMQLMQVVQGPPRGFGPPPRQAEGERPRRGYQGSTEARGFTRKPRFAEDDEQ